MYITVTIPAIRTVVTPVEGVDTREDQIEAMRVLSAGNTLMMVLLGGVLTLQVSEPHVVETTDQNGFLTNEKTKQKNDACRVGRNGLGDWN